MGNKYFIANIIGLESDKKKSLNSNLIFQYLENARIYIGKFLDIRIFIYNNIIEELIIDFNQSLIKKNSKIYHLILTEITKMINEIDDTLEKFERNQPFLDINYGGYQFKINSHDFNDSIVKSL